LGGNGAGKTSLLEAIYLLATTRSFRTSVLSDCVHHGAVGFHIAGEVASDQRTRLDLSWGAEFRSRLVNGKTGRITSHLAVLPVVAWAAAEAEVLIGAPVARRRFMDRGVVGIKPTALDVLNRYREALRAKRELLAREDRGPDDDETSLEAWNEVMATAAAEVIALRHAYVTRLSAALSAVIELTGVTFPVIDLTYKPSPPDGLEGALAIAQSLTRMGDRERRRHRPLLGPQRDELEIRWGGHEVKRVASAGEMKALSLLLVAAHGRVLEASERSPIYLLDDVDAELANNTLSSVWRAFSGARQVVASSNRPQSWLTLEVGTVWEMEKGQIKPL
jgi:DNA replication and repair protein RecF